MLYSQKLNLFKKIIILGIFISIIPLTIIILILGEISLLNSLLNNYLISGKSLFFPFLPCYNVFWFLPVEAHFIQFTTGHLIDILIVGSIISLAEICGYQYYKKICLNEDFLNISPFVSEQAEYVISQDQSIFFGFKEESSFSFNYKTFDNKFNRNQSFNKELSYELKNLRNFSDIIDFVLNRLLIHISLSKYKGKFRNILHSSIENFRNTLLIHNLIYPKTKSSGKFPNSSQNRGINWYFKTYFFKKLTSIIVKVNFFKVLNRYSLNK
jgi:hypothetical protein